MTGYGDPAPESLPHKIRKVIPEISQHILPCPQVDCEGWISYPRTVWGMIQHLNDFHEVSREDIADWLEVYAAEIGLDLSFPTPEDIPKEPGEQ